MNISVCRREFLRSAALLCATTAIPPAFHVAGDTPEPIIDVHQHVGYSGRSDAQLIAHQRNLGVTMTLLLPAGRPVERPSTDMGKSNGLAARALGNDACVAVAKRLPGEFKFYANEVPDLPQARAVIVKYLQRGAVGIGEQKFHLDCNSPPMELVAEIAAEYRVPVLLHFQHNAYNTRMENFHRILKKHPRAGFIGHAQLWWGNVDARHDPKNNYPKGPVTPGGLTERLLSEYPNLYGDLSAGSGLNALIRDEAFTRGFLERQQDKLLFGSDCNDSLGHGEGCIGARIIAAVRRLAPSRAVERKLLYENARKLFRLG